MAVLEEELPLQHAPLASQGKVVAGAAWRAVWATNASSLLAPEMQHHRVGGLSGWQHSPPTVALACLPFGPWRGSQTPEHNVCISEVDSPLGWALTSEPSKLVWPEE